MAAPATWTRGTTVRASATLAAGATSSAHDFDVSTKWEAHLRVTNTPGGTIAATRGVNIFVYLRTGSGTPVQVTTPIMTFDLPSAVVSTAESIAILLPPGLYTIKLFNVDATNAVTVEILMDTLDTIV